MADWNDALLAMQQRLDALDRQMAHLEKRKSSSAISYSAQPVFPVAFHKQSHSHHRTSPHAASRPVHQESPPALSPSPSSPSSSAGSPEYSSDGFGVGNTSQDVEFLHVEAVDCSPMTTAEWLDIYQDLDNERVDHSTLAAAPSKNKKRRIETVEEAEQNVNTKRPHGVF